MNGRCDKCEQSECRLRELYNILCGDQTSAESGIEDLGSSAGSQIDVNCFLLKIGFEENRTVEIDLK